MRRESTGEQAIGPQRQARAAPPRLARIAAVGSALLGVGHAAVSAYWALGGTRLLDTVGGSLEEWARNREATMIVVLWFVVVVKVMAASMGPAIAWDRVPRRVPDRLARVLAWIVAATLMGYGGILTAVGLLALHDVIDSTGADRTALEGHAYLWDPWFLAWGVTLALTLWVTRERRRPKRSPGTAATTPTSRSWSGRRASG
jgi:TRAP-type C4-dicarboxylate transport system permease small subunit